MVDYAQDELRDALRQQGHTADAEEEEPEKTQLIEDDNYDDVQEEWYTTTLNLLENIYTEKLRFWDKEILSEKKEFINKMLELFLLSQRLKSKREDNELRR